VVSQCWALPAVRMASILPAHSSRKPSQEQNTNSPAWPKHSRGRPARTQGRSQVRLPPAIQAAICAQESMPRLSRNGLDVVRGGALADVEHFDGRTRMPYERRDLRERDASARSEATC